jgi:hypothetical protein
MTPLAAQSVVSGGDRGMAWSLPQNTTVIDAGPRTYRFSVVYNTASSTGEIVRRQRVEGDYTRGLPQGQVEWNDVTVADANGAEGPFGSPQKQSFMDGFRYALGANSFVPEFFKSFPPAAVMERNLVWDTEMFEMFGQKYLDKLRLNEPLHVIPDQSVNMPGVGTFQNHDVVLEWVGRSRRNGQDCALIDYRAFLNPLRVDSSGITLNGRSDYWGEIWVSLATRQIEYATLYEEVTGEMKLPNQSVPQPMSVFRIGSFQPVSATH